jgi:GNAT superfamily N-acetyltransferase
MQIVQFELTPKHGNNVELKWIQATPMRGGAGSKAMKILQDLAQQDGITLTLFPWDKGAVSQAKLIKFYKKHGFQHIGKSKNMQWEPVTEVQTIAHTEEDDKFWNFKMMQYFNELQYKQKLKEAGSIGGLNLLVGPHGYSDAYFFMDNDKPVGLVAVVKKHDPEYRTISMFYLEPAYRRQGIAFDFYKMLLNDYNLMSDKIQSAAMQKVWEKLASMPGYSMKEVGERYLITKDTENTQQLDESLSRIVYHYTTTWAASKILASGKFELSSSLGSIEQQYAPKGYHYFLSTTRTPRGGYHDTIGQSAIMFVLDGNYYNSKYPSKPVDYWQNRDPAKSHHRTHEAEDRLFSKEPTIPINGVTAVHMFIKDDADPNVKGLARTILLEAKKRGIPAYYYTDQAAWRNLDTTKTSQLNTLAGQRKVGRSFSRHRGWLIPWLEVLQATDKSQLSDKGRKIVNTLTLYNNSYYLEELAKGLALDMSNARKPDSGPDRKNAAKIINYMKQNKLNTLIEFVDAMTKKWEALNKS